MKTVKKIDPEKEYENAKAIIALVAHGQESADDISALESSTNNMMTAIRVLMEREEKRRAGYKPPAQDPSTPRPPKGRKKGDIRKEAKKLPSERFPHLEIQDKNLDQEDNIPLCPCCHKPMKKSGLFETSEKLEVEAPKYYIVRSNRAKYSCPHCHGHMANTPAEPSIVPGSNYGDSLIIDVSIAKYASLIPIERYVQIAANYGVVGLPPHSVIELTHYLASFLICVYDKIRAEVLSAKVLLADETPHEMLEEGDGSQWYLWGFFSAFASCFETHNTRSSSVPIEFLKDSQALYLLTDECSAYGKALKDAELKYNKKIEAASCNAHAYRRFRDVVEALKEEAAPFLAIYEKIYTLERERKEKINDMTAEQQLKMRRTMYPLFEELKALCEQKLTELPPQSGLVDAIKYFLNAYEGFTLCTEDIDIPLDNNLSERGLRAPVIGRKTWYGSHSKRGARTSAILFSIFQTCKMNNVNPRKYLPYVVESIHRGEDPPSPHEYSQLDLTPS